MDRKVIDLGWCVAIIQKQNPMLKIISPGDCNPETYVSFPPQNIEVWRKENIEKLRDGLNEILVED